VAYTVRISAAAERALDRLESQIRRRISRAIDDLQTSPRPPGVKKLSGTSDMWRIRVGDYRVVYQIMDRVLLVLIIDVGHRGDVYR
jgi:mRNA interferase RelE/StbE